MSLEQEHSRIFFEGGEWACLEILQAVDDGEHDILEVVQRVLKEARAGIKEEP